MCIKIHIYIRRAVLGVCNVYIYIYGVRYYIWRARTRTQARARTPIHCHRYSTEVSPNNDDISDCKYCIAFPCSAGLVPVGCENEGTAVEPTCMGGCSRGFRQIPNEQNDAIQRVCTQWDGEQCVSSATTEVIPLCRFATLSSRFSASHVHATNIHLSSEHNT